jgi:threonylcarbamoyladenosine tRNA methylthiotransferase MtaB
MFASVINLGCRLNQSEGDSLRQYLSNQGYELLTTAQASSSNSSRLGLGLELGLVIVNTCCVTKEAERSSMNRIRRAAALKPKPRVIATGCLAELAPERLRAIPGVDEVLGIEAKNRLIGWLPPVPLNPRIPNQEPGTKNQEPLMPLPDRSRAFLKVQDGCPNSCAFCVVSTLRTRAWSKPAQKVRQEAQNLLDQGFHELVLVGLNLGTYGADAGTSLSHLLEELSGLNGNFRIRLSSLEPDTITPDLVNSIQGLCRSSILCPHLHTPLQSGDDRILAAMARHYTAGQYRDLLQRLIQAVPDLNIGTDVIVGFPGETEQTLETTRALLEVLPLGYLHVFTFSSRPGTRAAQMKDGLGRETAKRWMTRLRNLGADRSLDYRTRFVGAVRPAVLLPHSSTAVTDNYINVQCGPTGLNHRELREHGEPGTSDSDSSVTSVSSVVRIPEFRNPQCGPSPLVRVRIDRADPGRTLGTLLSAAV